MEKEKNENVGVLFALLGIWEDDQRLEEKDKTFLACLNRSIILFSGMETDKANTIKLYLKGLRNEYDELNHTKVKSIIFHCIGIEKRK